MATQTELRTFRFTLTLSIATYLSDEELDELCGKVLATGFDDASLHTSGPTVYLSFDREAADLGDAISSAVKAVERAGLGVSNIEIG
jgi:hypothetical protein